MTTSCPFSIIFSVNIAFAFVVTSGRLRLAVRFSSGSCHPLVTSHIEQEMITSTNVLVSFITKLWQWQPCRSDIDITTMLTLLWLVFSLWLTSGTLNRWASLSYNARGRARGSARGRARGSARDSKLLLKFQNKNLSNFLCPSMLTGIKICGCNILVLYLDMCTIKHNAISRVWKYVQYNTTLHAAFFSQIMSSGMV